MKILQVSPIPISLGGVEKGGVESHISELSNYSRQKNDVFFFRNKISKSKTNNISYSYRNIFEYVCYFIMGLKLILRVKDVNSMKLKFKIISDYVKMAGIIEKHNIDIVHVHGVHNHACYVCHLLSIPCVVTDHGIGHKKIFDNDKDFLIKNIRNCKRIIAISNDSYHNLLKISDIDKIVKINNPINIPPISSLYSWSEIDYDFVVFNGISETWGRKGLSEVAKHLDSIMESLNGLYFVVVCDDENFARLISHCNNNENRLRIRHLLPMNRNKSLGLVHKAKFNLAPSVKEGFSIAYLESIGLGTPVIGFSSNIIEMNDLFSSHANIPYEYGVSSIVELVDDMMANVRNNEYVGDISLLSWENTLIKFDDVYTHALNG